MVSIPQAVRYIGATKRARVRIVISSRLRLMVAMHAVRATAGSDESSSARRYPSHGP
jgi:hypothetical protein